MPRVLRFNHVVPTMLTFFALKFVITTSSSIFPQHFIYSVMDVRALNKSQVSFVFNE